MLAASNIDPSNEDTVRARMLNSFFLTGKATKTIFLIDLKDVRIRIPEK